MAFKLSSYINLAKTLKKGWQNPKNKNNTGMVPRVCLLNMNV